MRRFSVALALFVAIVVALVNVNVGVVAATTTPSPTLYQCVKIVHSELYAKGHLTIATDNPVYAPWFENNSPSNGDGYESALAYLLAHELGFAPKDVKWVTEPFADSYQSGTKNFDFDINEVTYSAAWAQNVAFSTTYYNVQQSLVAMRSDPIVKHHTVAQLRKYRYGAISGTAAATYVTTDIKPTTSIKLFSTLALAEAALESGAIDALVIDTPTGNHAVTWDIVAANDAPLATQVGQFAYVPNTDYYALVMQKKNPLAVCVDVALAKIHTDGSIATLTKKWLGIYTSVPSIKP